MRRLLVKPRKPKILVNTNSAETQENQFISTSVDNQNSCCPRAKDTLNNKFQVNTLLDGGAVPNIISLESVKKLGIKDPKLIASTANGQKSQIIQGPNLKFSAIGYNHNAFPLLLGRRVLKRLEIITDWETCTWSMKTPHGIKKYKEIAHQF